MSESLVQKAVCKSEDKSEDLLDDEGFYLIYNLKNNNIIDNKFKLYTWANFFGIYSIKKALEEVKISDIFNKLINIKNKSAVVIVIYRGNIIREDMFIKDFKTTPIFYVFNISKPYMSSISSNYNANLINQQIQTIFSNLGINNPGSNNNFQFSFQNMNSMLDTLITTGNQVNTLVDTNNLPPLPPTSNSEDIQNTENEEFENTDEQETDFSETETETDISNLENGAIEENIIPNNEETVNDISIMLTNLVNIYNNNNECSEKYKDQIELMKSMGFTDERKILESLIIHEGNVEGAANYYLNI